MSRRLSASIGGFRYNRFADFRYFNFLQEVENDFDLLRPLAAGLVQDVNDDLLDELVHNGGVNSEMSTYFSSRAGKLFHNAALWYKSTLTISIVK